MALRLIEVVLPEERVEEINKLLEEHKPLGIWQESLSGGKVMIKIVLPTEKTEVVTDLLEKRFLDVNGFRIILLPVEATIPRPEEPEKKPSEEKEAESEKAKIERISREELYSDISVMTKLSNVFVVMVVLSSIVAAIGIMRSNVAIIIGAMVIAPLLGPNVALSFATTLGDLPLARNAIKTNVVGIFTALVFSVLLGYFLAVNPQTPEILSRTEVGLGDIALALASGSAGALALTTGVSASLIGVMVAVALLPPLVTLGLLLGGGYWDMAFGALLLLLTNLICINLAGVTTFLIQGIHPLTWWEKDRAKKATRIAILLWILFLSALVIVILLSKGG